MKTLRFLFVLCLILGFAAPANSQGRSKQIEKPFKGTFYAVVVEENGPYEVLSITGNATHTGTFTGDFKFDRLFTVAPGGILIGETIYEGTIVAANGDKIFFESTDPGMILDLPMNPVNVTGIMSGWTTFTGGTGRFLNCSGAILTIGVFNTSLNYAMWTSEGTITY